jgi:hypothetical protein
MSGAAMAERPPKPVAGCADDERDRADSKVVVADPLRPE